MKKLFCLFIFCFMSLMVHGQTIQGRIISVDAKPIKNVRIRILSDSAVVKESITDASGLFAINAGRSTFRAELYFVGYIPQLLNFNGLKNDEVKNLQDIILKEDSIVLGEVTVESASIINKGDKMLIFPKQKQIDASSSGLELLQKTYIPGLYVDPISQAIQIDNKSNVVYRINGINSTIQDIIAINPKQISRIEYQRTPDARDADAAGVINIYLKKETGTFLSGFILGAFTTGFVNGNLNLSTGYANSNLSLNYNVNYRDYSKRYADENETLYSAVDTIVRSKAGLDAPFGYLQQNINLGYTYTNEKNMFNVKWLNSIYTSHDRNEMNVSGLSITNPNSFQNIYSKTNNYFPSLDIYNRLNIDDQQHIDVNLVGSIGKSNYKRSFQEEYETDSTFVSRTHIQAQSESVNFEVLYANGKSESFKYNAGLKSSYNHTENEVVGNTSANEDFNRFNLYPYVSISGNMKGLGYTAGTGMKILRYSNSINQKSFYSNLSNLSLFYKINNKANIQYVFNYSPNYPSLSSMSTIEQSIDGYIKTHGNPDLKQFHTISNAMHLSFHDKKVSSSLSLRQSKAFNPIRDIIRFEGDHYIIEPMHTQSESSYNIELGSGISSIFNCVDLQLTLGWSHYQSNTNTATHHLNDYYYSVGVNYYHGNFSSSFGWKKPQKSLMGEYIYTGENNSFWNASYKHKNFLFGTGFYFPFTKGSEYRTERVSDIAPSNKFIRIKDNAYMFFVAVSYTVNWGKSLFNINRILNNNNSEDAIMKVNDN